MSKFRWIDRFRRGISRSLQADPWQRATQEEVNRIFNAQQQGLISRIEKLETENAQLRTQIENLQSTVTRATEALLSPPASPPAQGPYRTAPPRAASGPSERPKLPTHPLARPTQPKAVLGHPGLVYGALDWLDRVDIWVLDHHRLVTFVLVLTTVVAPIAAAAAAAAAAAGALR
jgi:hypothetical protein